MIISTDPSIAAASAKIAADIDAFIESGGRIERLPTSGSPITDVTQYNGREHDKDRSARGGKAGRPAKFDRARYVTISDICTEGGKVGLLKIARRTFSDGVKSGKYPPNAHAIGATRLWLRTDIEAIARGGE